MKVEIEEPEMIGDLGQTQPVELTANSGNSNVNNNNNQSSNKKNHHHHHHNHQQQRHPDFPYYGPDPMSIPLNPHVSLAYSLLIFPFFFFIFFFATLFTVGSRCRCLVCVFVLEIKDLKSIINVDRSNGDISGCF